MESLRALILRRRAMAMLVVLAALLLKAVVPAGYMPAAGKTISLQICGDATGHAMTTSIVVPRSPDAGDTAVRLAKETCPWSALSDAALRAALPAFLAIALAFILLTGFAPVRTIRLRGDLRLRPPPCGPPLFS